MMQIFRVPTGNMSYIIQSRMQICLDMPRPSSENRLSVRGVLFYRGGGGWVGGWVGGGGAIVFDSFQ